MKTAADPVDADDVVAQLEETHVDGTVEAADWGRLGPGDTTSIAAEGRRGPEYLGINITDKSMADIEYDPGHFQVKV